MKKLSSLQIAQILLFLVVVAFGMATVAIGIFYLVSLIGWELGMFLLTLLVPVFPFLLMAWSIKNPKL